MSLKENNLYVKYLIFIKGRFKKYIHLIFTNGPRNDLVIKETNSYK